MSNLLNSCSIIVALHDALLRFLKLYVRFESKKLITKFDDELDIITNRSNTMGLKEFVLDRERRMARKEGKEEGKQEGKEIGREEGKEIGREEERENKNFTFTQNLITQTDFSDEKIALLAGVEVEYVTKIRNSL